MQANHQNKFDMLRGVASIAVLLPHVTATFLYRFLGAQHPLAQACGTLAHHAVLVFFLLSGYLITSSIVTNLRRNGSFDVSEYITARVTRIYPPLIGAILVVVLASAIIQGLALPGAQHYGIPGDLYAVRDKFVVTAMDVPRVLLMQNGMLDADGPLWSLNIEFHLYIAALFVTLSVRGSSTPKRVAAGLLAVALSGWWIHTDSQFAFYLAIWSLGALLSIWGAEIERFKLAYAGLAWAGLAVHLVLLFSAPALLSSEEQNIWVALGLQFVACLSYAYAFFISDWGKQPPLLLKKTGDFSYSLYVIHFPLLLLILSATQDFMGSSIWRSCAVAATATVAAITISSAFAAFFENQRRFKSLVRKVIDFLLMSKSRTSRA